MEPPQMTPEREAELFAKLDLLLELYRRNADEIAALRLEAATARAESRADIADFRAEMRADIADFRAEMRADVAGFRTEVRADAADFRTESRAEAATTQAQLHELRVAQQEANLRSARMEGRIEEQSKFLQLVLASRQPRKAAG
jgi:hypothetical protein